jgi:hypothetical protein
VFRSAVEARGTEAVAVESPANGQIVDTIAVGATAESIASLTASARDSDVEINDNAVSQSLGLVVAEVRQFVAISGLTEANEISEKHD